MTPSRHDPHDNPERDAWLTEALRHAPDADAAPPAALREAILREARAATAGARAVPAPGTAHRLLAAWSWLARPPVAAGFASVMVATLVGLMWWDRPIDETLQRPPTPTSTPGAQQPAAAAPTPAGEGAAVQPAPPARAGKAAAPRTAAPQEQTSAERTEPAAFSDERKRVAMPPAAPDAAVAAARDDAATPSAGASARALTKVAPATSGALARRQEATAAPAAPLAELLASAAEQPQRWSWQRSGSAQPMSPALQRWLQQLELAATLQWRATDGAPPPSEGSVLRLYRDNAPYATLRLDADAVWLVPASTTARPASASLPTTALADLKRALDEAAP